jgi:APA family basic amino acid/polyamine antiporter
LSEEAPTREGKSGSAEPSRLARRLGTTDAVVIGLGSMIGAGVFAAIGPAARAAGNGLLIALVIAAFVAYPAPLAVAVEAGRLAWLAPAVRIGATVASLGVLLSLIVGVSRTIFAMASNRDLPGFFAAVHPRYRVPHRAELGVGLLVATTAALADIRSAIGFSSFAVLTYYAVTNASALALDASERRWPRWLAIAGLIGCAALGFSLPVVSVVAGSALLIVGVAVFLVLKRLRPAHERRR